MVMLLWSSSATETAASIRGVSGNDFIFQQVSAHHACETTDLLIKILWTDRQTDKLASFINAQKSNSSLINYGITNCSLLIIAATSVTLPVVSDEQGAQIQTA